MILQDIRRSFSARLTLLVTGLVTAIFVVALALLLRFTLSVSRTESQERIMQILESTALQVDHELLQTEMTAITTRWMIVEHLSTPDSIAALCRNVKESSPRIDNCYVTTVEETALKNKARWYEPSLDSPADSVALKRMKMSYQLPIFNKRGHPTMILTIDIHIDWQDFTKDIAKDIPYSQCFLQGKGGQYMLDGSGYKEIQFNGTDAHEFYRPLRNKEWGIVLICPDQELLGGFYYLMTIAIIVAVIVLLVLLFLCRRVIDKNLRSLDMLLKTVIHISQNQFDELIPYKGRKDEIGELQQSFAKMQQALKARIGEINQKTSMLKRQNEELNAAYERGQEDERTKSAFLSQTTEKFMQPVNAINAATDQLCKNYHNFSKEEMSTLQALIIYNSDAVTYLIDQMLLTSQDKEPEHENQPNSTGL